MDRNLLWFLAVAGLIVFVVWFAYNEGGSGDLVPLNPASGMTSSDEGLELKSDSGGFWLGIQEPSMVLKGVPSESMKPMLSGEEYLLLKETSFSDLEEGDVVAFNMSALDDFTRANIRLDVDGETEVVAHRVALKKPTEDCVVTKGDNNPTDDACVPMDAVIGKVYLVMYD